MVIPLEYYLKVKDSSDNALVTVLIPTRNRPDFVYELLESFKNKTQFVDLNKFKFVISDNSDTDFEIKDEYLEKLAPVNIEKIRPDKKFITAEENLFFGLQFVETKYVWILGDDDPINFFEISNLVKILEKGEYKAYFWNSNLINASGDVLRRFRIPAQQSHFSLSMNDLVTRAGAWYATAGFSTWIIETKLLQTKSAHKQMEITKNNIYSHVILFMKCFGDQEVLFINQPLVYYRMNDYDEKGNSTNWTNYSDKTGKYYREAWTFDFPKMVDSLVDQGLLPSDFMGQIIEQDHNGYRFPLIFIFTDLLFEQIEISLGEKSQTIPQEKLAYSLSIIDRYIPSLNLNVNKWLKLNLQLLANQKSPSIWYRIKFKGFGADINLVRYNNWLLRTQNPFHDYVKINKKNSININEFAFIDFEMIKGIAYVNKKKIEKTKLLNTNLLLLRSAQYLPKRFRKMIIYAYRSIYKVHLKLRSKIVK